jgi:hypothetical protein
VLEVPSGPIIANISPSIAREIRLDHRLDEGASVLVLNERLVKQALGQSQGNVIHFGGHLAAWKRGTSARTRQVVR